MCSAASEACAATNAVLGALSLADGGKRLQPIQKKQNKMKRWYASVNSCSERCSSCASASRLYAPPVCATCKQANNYLYKNATASSPPKYRFRQQHALPTPPPRNQPGRTWVHFGERALLAPRAGALDGRLTRPDRGAAKAIQVNQGMIKREPLIK